jgi:transglutaminase-like putative cysteine protease
MPRLSIRHLTTYRYRKPVAFGEHRMLFRPLQTFDQQLLAAEVEISPEPSLLRHVHDVSGACVGVARFDLRADRLAFESRVRVEHTPHAPFELEIEATSIGLEPFAYAPDEAPELASSITRRHPDAGEVEAWARRFLRASGRMRLSALLSDMTRAIRSEFAYTLRLAGHPQTPCETLSSGKGSCRDFALLLMEAARSLGLAARFVTGYIYSGSPKAGHAGGGHTHAWARVYVPGCGWVDFDPTNGIIGNADLVRVAVVSEPRLALPLHGCWSGRRGDFLGMDVEVDVTVETDVQQAPAAPPAPVAMKVALA